MSNSSTPGAVTSSASPATGLPTHTGRKNGFTSNLDSANMMQKYVGVQIW